MGEANARHYMATIVDAEGALGYSEGDRICLTHDVVNSYSFSNKVLPRRRPFNAEPREHPLPAEMPRPPPALPPAKRHATFAADLISGGAGSSTGVADRPGLALPADVVRARDLLSKYPSAARLLHRLTPAELADLPSLDAAAGAVGGTVFPANPTVFLPPDYVPSRLNFIEQVLVAQAAMS